ncbi:MAG TPA: LytR C-terminal domain-containing protein [Gaiellaceae bacterium]|nr:LytR C-terminal domain-containing protein [Gaiellaceae bacterium]
MEYAEPLSRPFPWRAATLVAAALAAVEFVVLIVVGAFLLARPIHHNAAKATTTPAPVAHTRVAAHVQHVRVAVHALLPRTHVSVLVLNGNGVSGAAARMAAQLHGLGYRIGGKRNAQRHDYARSIVMYVPSYAPEAQRLARDTGIRLVSPVDGLTPRMLKGVKLVVLLGS